MQGTFKEKGNQVEFNLVMKFFWKSSPFVKSIVESQTLAGSKKQYESLIKFLSKRFNSDGGEEDEEEKVEDFSKMKKILKIIILSFVLLSIIILLFRMKIGHPIFCFRTLVELFSIFLLYYSLFHHFK